MNFGSKTFTRHNFQRKSLGIPTKKSEAALPFSAGPPRTRPKI